MDSSDRLLVPCFFAALAINAVGIWAVSSSEIFDPNRRPPPPLKVAPDRQVVQLYKRPTPSPPTPKPVVATPMPPPTPTPPPPKPTPTPPPVDKPTPRPTPVPQTRLQATTQKPAPAKSTRVPLPQANLNLGATSARGAGPTVNENETHGDSRIGKVTTTTEHVEGPKSTTPVAPPFTPPPTAAPIVAATPPPTPAPPPPTPVPTPVPTPKRVTVSVTSEPATPLGSWQDVVGNVSIPDGDDASSLKKSATVEIETDVEGGVKSVRMQSSSGIGAVDDQIKRACRKMRFKPPTQDGNPLPARFTHTFTLS